MTTLQYCGVLVACAALILSVEGRFEVKAPKSAQLLMTEAEKAAVASVDGDPEFIVGVRGLAQPLCFRLEGRPGHVVRLLQDPESGVVVNARISRPVPGSNKTYLSAVLISRRNFRLIAKPTGRVHVNRHRFDWGPVSIRMVHGHRVLIAPTLLALTLRNKNVTLVVKRHLPEGRRLVNGTVISTAAPHSAPNTAHNATSGNHGNPVTSRTSRRRGNRRRDDIDRGPRRRSRRQRRPGRRGNRHNANDNGNQPPGTDRTKRDVNSDFHNFDDDGIPSQMFDADADHTTLTRTRRQTSSRDNDNTATTRPSGTRSRSRSGSRTQTANRGGTQADDTSGGGPTTGVPARDLAAYMGFYVSDARDLSPQTHGLLGQFLHKRVTLQKVRRKANGVTKARLLVETPQPHMVKAKLRTRTNLALNSSSTCWWLRDGGRGVVDSLYTDYLVSRIRYTDLLPLPPGQIAQ
ncbi:uncharacterized protein [Littorina saxatilis]|uniref:Inter-alpha-trypsin inhibitor heavy chain C-terminal domain-containing protein n=1 Tax=Littorina saxatilis TaxID=31220 RepID=A0AAN9GCV3_9CAEN